MNSKWLASFMAVAQEGSITAAAKSLFISPQALLQQINLLEDEVGVKLFSRARSGMSLTLSGKEFMTGAQQIETLYAKTLSRCRLASRAEETIRIPMMSSIIMPEFMEKVCAAYKYQCAAPLKTEFIPDYDFDAWMEGLKNLKYDMVECYAIDGQCPQEIHFEYFSDVQSWCIMSDLHPLANKRKIIPEELNGSTLLLPGNNQKLLRYLQIYLESHDIKVSFESSVTNDRYPLIQGLNQGYIYLANEDIAHTFIGYTCVPLDFDTHVQQGIACREEMYELYKPFFEVAHSVNMA